MVSGPTADRVHPAERALTGQSASEVNAHRQLHLETRVVGVSRPRLSGRIEAEDRLTTLRRPARLQVVLEQSGCRLAGRIGEHFAAQTPSGVDQVEDVNTSNWRSIIRGAPVSCCRSDAIVVLDHGSRQLLRAMICPR